MVINWIAFSLKVLCSLNASFITNLSKVCPKLTFISSLGFFIAFLTLVSNYCTPTVSFLLHSQHLQISNSTSVFSRKQQNTCLAKPSALWIQSSTVPCPTCQRKQYTENIPVTGNISTLMHLKAMQQISKDSTHLFWLFLNLEHLPSQIQPSFEWQHEINQIHTKGVEKV